MINLALVKWRATRYTVSGTYSSTKFKYSSSFCREQRRGVRHCEGRVKRGKGRCTGEELDLVGKADRKMDGTR
jgi:hypothetical protein